MFDKMTNDSHNLGGSLDSQPKNNFDSVELIREQTRRERDVLQLAGFIEHDDWQSAKAVVDRINKGSSHSVLDTYNALTVEARQAVELFSDKNGQLKMRLTGDFIDQAKECNRVTEAVDHLDKRDLDGLRRLLPINGSEMEQLKNEMLALGWKIVEIPRPKYQLAHIGNHPDGGVKFVPPAGVGKSNKPIVIMNWYSDRPTLGESPWFQRVEELEDSE